MSDIFCWKWLKVSSSSVGGTGCSVPGAGASLPVAPGAGMDPHLSSAAAQPWLLHRPRPHELKEGKGLIHTPITQELQQLTWHF